jgi:hypothetical protein
MFNKMNKFVAIREVKKETWNKIKGYCKANHITISQLIEKLVNENLPKNP